MIPPLSEEGIHRLSITLLRLLKNGNQGHKTLKSCKKLLKNTVLNRKDQA
jgi:hypothetical protein